MAPKNVHVYEEPLKDIDMEQMIDALCDPPDDDGEEYSADEHIEDPIVTELNKLASTPLFKGSRSSIL